VRKYGGYSIVVTLFSKTRQARPAGVLEHCREEEPNSYFSILGAFTSNCFTTKDVHAHLFIHNFTFRYEIIMGNTLAAPPPKKKCKLYQRFSGTF